MGPLVPEIIGNEFDFIIALFIGIGFGFVLEQAGFSSTKKLVGLFYGYDFTVLRVFFTAGVTAMIGILLLGHFNLLDLNIIFINPTFLYSALLGGGIMGIGFILGGFCPGTSVCAAAVGKIDAMAFLGGSFIGIFLFMEGFPIWGEIFTMQNLGDLKMNDVLGISPELFAVIMTFVAIGTFLFIRKVENKVNKKSESFDLSKFLKRTALAIVPFFVISLLAFTPNQSEKISSYVDEALNNNYEIEKISADNFSSKLLKGYYNYNVIDIRSKEEYKKSHLPLAINIPLDSLMNKEWLDYFNQKHKANVFYGNNFEEVKKAYFISTSLGKAESYGLKESEKEFNKLYFNLSEPPKENKHEYDIYKFRKRTGEDLIKLDIAMKRFSQPVKKKVVKAKGGCA